MHRSLYKRSCSLLHSQSALKQLLLESLIDNFQQYFKQNAEALHFCQILAPRFSTRHSTKEPDHCFFRRALKNTTLGKYY